KAVKIDRDRRVVVGKTLDRKAIAYASSETGAPASPPVEAPYDHVIIATGSRPCVPPMEGFGGPGTFLFRTIDDCERIADYARDRKKAAVIGGGRRSLEAPRGRPTHGVQAIVTDDQMRTSDPDVFSLGECVQHRGKIYGLVDPIWEMAGVLADVLTGKTPQAAYLGSRLGTKLKVMGVELASMGETKPAGP